MSKKLGDLLDKAPEKPSEEPWSSVPDGGIIWVRRTAEHELPDLYALTQREVDANLAPYEVFTRMYAQNADSLWSVYRASDQTRSDAKLIGYYALIHLNEAGREMLEAVGCAAVKKLAEAKPDVVCLQELKAPDEKFPRDLTTLDGFLDYVRASANSSTEIIAKARITWRAFEKGR